MLTKIVVDGAATFRSASTLETDKKINLIYGLNGSGKSTICRFLRNPTDKAYAKCSAIGGDGKKILVFNEDFMREHFYESPTIKGIFSLSKQNKEAEQAIEAARAVIVTLQKRKEASRKLTEDALKGVAAELDSVVDKTFDIKRRYAGGDRVLDFCLENLMAKKDKLFDHLRKAPKPDGQPQYTVKELQAEARLLTNDNSSNVEPLLPHLRLDLESIETDSLFDKAIVGTHNSSFGHFIEQLKNSDWVRAGLQFISFDAPKPIQCPFCQHPTIDDHFEQEVRACFDRSYDEQVAKIRSHRQRYESQIASIPSLVELQSTRFYNPEIGSKYEVLQAHVRENVLHMEEKLKNPSSSVALKRTRPALDDFSAAVDKVNAIITEYNRKIANKAASLAEIKRRFWTLMRWEYDQSITFHGKLQLKKHQIEEACLREVADIDAELAAQSKVVTEAQEATVNIDVAIDRINAELLDLGVLDFRITRHSDHLYQLERPSGGSSTFHSLSEGEKMIIALLYFCELCEGNEARDEIPKDRIVVIDDPISSMSHIFVFNVGRLLRSRFFAKESIRQVFVFTHSLYFFYELTDIDHDRRKKSQALFRVTKNTSGSNIVPMKYEDIQNDYQAYWRIVNDADESPALIANCMRNVIEYFFGFVEKKAYNVIFQRPELSTNRFQAFNRYMNRESHSIAQNVFDLKEFNYQDFRDGLKLVFEVCGYGEHYKQMTKIQ